MTNKKGKGKGKEGKCKGKKAYYKRAEVKVRRKKGQGRWLMRRTSSRRRSPEIWRDRGLILLRVSWAVWCQPSGVMGVAP